MVKRTYSWRRNPALTILRTCCSLWWGPVLSCRKYEYADDKLHIYTSTRINSCLCTNQVRHIGNVCTYIRAWKIRNPFVFRRQFHSDSMGQKGGNTSRCRCLHSSLTLLSFSSRTFSRDNCPNSVPKRALYPIPFFFCVRSIPILFRRQLVRECRPRLCFFKRNLICLCYSFVILGTLVCPVLPGESASPSQLYRRAVFGVCLNDIWTIVDTSSAHAHERFRIHHSIPIVINPGFAGICCMLFTATLRSYYT